MPIDAGPTVLDVQWLENDVFLVTYSPSVRGGNDVSVVVAISRGKTSVEFARFDDDPAADAGAWEAREERRFVASLKNW
jgi:hypothetical protein